jgi:hypothetical protein
MPCIIMTVASCSYVCMCVWCQIAVPVGRLSKEDLQPRLSVHQGIPATASILAFEPVQRVLAVASLDGRIKLFGLPGVEILLQSPTPAPCKFLKARIVCKVIQFHSTSKRGSRYALRCLT